MADNNKVVVELGRVAKERGIYTAGNKYYKDNIVEYMGAAYIAEPATPNGYVTVAPWTTDRSTLNTGWRVFADGNPEYIEEVADNCFNQVRDTLSGYQPIVVEGDVSNAPDEEDLTSVNIGGTDVLKFKDKAYSPIVYSGMGRKTLRKNMVNGVNVLTQEMVSDANTIYVIQYDFDLNDPEGENPIEISENCVLEFNGGSLKNGKIISQTPIFINQYCIDSTLDISELQVINNVFDINDRLNTEPIEDYIEYISSLPYNKIITTKNTLTRIIRQTKIVDSTILNECNFYLYSDSTDYTICILLQGKNIEVKNSLINSSGSRHGFIRLNEAENISIANCVFNDEAVTNYSDYAIYCNTKATNVCIDSCEFHSVLYTILYNDSVAEQGADFRTFNGVTYTGTIGHTLEVRNCSFDLKDMDAYTSFTFVGVNCPDEGFEHVRYINNRARYNITAGSGSPQQIPFFIVKTIDFVVTDNSIITDGSRANVAGGYHFEHCERGIIISNYVRRVKAGYHIGACKDCLITSNIADDCSTGYAVSAVSRNSERLKFYYNITSGTITYTLLMDHIQDSEFIGNNFKGQEETIRSGSNIFFKENYFSDFKIQVFTSVADDFSNLTFVNNTFGTNEAFTISTLKSVADFVKVNGLSLFSYGRNPNGYIQTGGLIIDRTNFEIFKPTPLKENYYTRALFSYATTPAGLQTQEDGLIFYNRQARQIQVYDAVKGAVVAFDGNNITKYGNSAPTTNMNPGGMYYNTSTKRPGFWNSGIEAYLDVNGRDMSIVVGTSTARPTLSNRTENIGYLYFDTTIGKPIWWTGSAWVDATGVIAGTPTSGTFANKPTVSANSIPVGFKYFCTDRQTTEGATNGIEIIHKGNDVWVDALGRVVS